MSITLINHSKSRKCIIISQEALSLLVRSHRTTRRKSPRLRLRYRLLKLLKMTTNTRISMFLHKKRNYVTIPPILEEVRVMHLNLISQRYLVEIVYLMAKKSPLPKKRLRDQNHISIRRPSQSPRINRSPLFRLRPLALIKNILRYLKTILMISTSWIP